MMKLRFAMPAALVDINRLPGLDRIDHVDGQLRLGALVRHNAVAESDLVRRHNHVMAAAAPWIADPLVRNLGTIGGSLAHADPEGDWASVMLACRGEVVATSAGGERVIPVDELITDMFTTSLRPGELLTEVRVPAPTRPEPAVPTSSSNGRWATTPPWRSPPGWSSTGAGSPMPASR